MKIYGVRVKQLNQINPLSPEGRVFRNEQGYFDSNKINAKLKKRARKQVRKLAHKEVKLQLAS